MPRHQKKSWPSIQRPTVGSWPTPPPRGPLLAAAGQGHPRRLWLLAAPLRLSSRAPAAPDAPPRPPLRPAAGSGRRARAEAPARRRPPTCARHRRVPTPPRASASVSTAHLATPPGSAGEDRPGASASPPQGGGRGAHPPERALQASTSAAAAGPGRRRPLPSWPREEEAAELELQPGRRVESREKPHPPRHCLCCRRGPGGARRRPGKEEGAGEVGAR